MEAGIRSGGEGTVLVSAQAPVCVAPSPGSTTVGSRGTISTRGQGACKGNVFVDGRMMAATTWVV